MLAARSPKAPWPRCSATPRWCGRISVSPMLEVSSLSASYGKHQALTDVALALQRAEIVAILGANGAGKTTLLKAIAGLLRPHAGAQIKLNGRDIGVLEA